MISALFIMLAAESAAQDLCTMAHRQDACETTQREADLTRNELDRCLIRTGTELAKTDDPRIAKFVIFAGSCAAERGKCVAAYVNHQWARSASISPVETVDAWRIRLGNAAKWCDERFEIFGPRTIGTLGDRQY